MVMVKSKVSAEPELKIAQIYSIELQKVSLFCRKKLAGGRK